MAFVAGELAKAHNGQTRRQQRAGDLVEGEVAHRRVIVPLNGRRLEPALAREARPLLRPALLHATGAGATAQAALKKLP